jgi:putative FmdB family regulatory protein
MPVYEFHCNGCGAKVSVFTRSINAEAKGVCERCGGVDLRRLYSPLRVLRTPKDVNKLNKRELLDGVDYSNPQSMAQFLRRVQDEFNDGGSEETEEVIKRLEYGENVQKTLQIDEHHNHSHGGYDFSQGERDPEEPTAPSDDVWV